MNTADLHVSPATVRRVRKNKAQKKSTRRNGSNGHSNGTHLAAAGTLTRTKSLLLAALRVWELKQRVGE